MKRSSLLVVALAVALLGAACAKKPVMDQTKSDGYNNAPTTTEPTPTPNDTSMTNPSQEGSLVLMKTSKGDITLRLFEKEAPIASQNFLDLIAKHFYDGIQFHRVIKGFMIQGGDPLTKTDPTNYAIHGTGGPGYTIEDEFNNGLKNTRGRLAMARTAAPHSAGSQFYIVTDDAPTLDGNYTVFGEVLNGMDVVDAIVSVPTNSNNHPIDPVVITSIEIVAGK